MTRRRILVVATALLSILISTLAAWYLSNLYMSQFDETLLPHQEAVVEQSKNTYSHIRKIISDVPEDIVWEAEDLVETYLSLLRSTVLGEEWRAFRDDVESFVQLEAETIQALRSALKLEGFQLPRIESYENPDVDYWVTLKCAATLLTVNAMGSHVVEEYDNALAQLASSC